MTGNWTAPRKPRFSVDELQARIKATSAVQPDLSRALIHILGLWETSDRVLKDRSTSLPHWSGGRNSALVDVVNALADGYRLIPEGEEESP